MLIDTSAESALLAARTRLHALGVPADDLPDDLVPTVAGGSLMPSLPGWTPARARDWAAVAVRWPDVARRVVAWCDENAGRLANLDAVVVRPNHGGLVEMRRTDHPDIYVNRGLLDLDGSGHWGRAVEMNLEQVLEGVNHFPRPWHAELAAAVAAARRGEGEDGPGRIVVDGGRSTRAAPGYQLRATTRLRVVPVDYLMRVQGRVSRGPFCGAEPGELRFAGLRTDAVEDGSIPLSYLFHFRPGLPWSRFLRPDGGSAELRDAAGNPAHELADFFELP